MQMENNYKNLKKIDEGAKIPYGGFGSVIYLFLDFILFEMKPNKIKIYIFIQLPGYFKF